MSRQNSEYKKDEIMPKTNSKMSPTNTFEHELIISKDGPVGNDKLYKATPLKKGEVIEEGEGSIGCFVAEGRSSLQRLIEDFNLKLAKVENKVDYLERDITDLRQGTDVIYVQLQRKYAKEFNNEVAQLLNALVHANMIELLKDKRSRFANCKLLSFEEVISRSSKEEISRIQKDPTYQKLTSIMNKDFLQAIQQRNKEIHPEEINIEQMSDKSKFIGNAEHLTDEQKKVFFLTKAAFDETIAMDRLDALLKTYKDDRNKT